MIELTKINGEIILINSDQIEYVELIPESKITMLNGKHHVVIQTKEEIVEKVLDFNLKRNFNGQLMSIKENE